MSVRIADICSIKSGKRLPKGADFADEVTPYPYIRARDIKNGRINISDLVYLPEEVQKRIKQYIVETNEEICRSRDFGHLFKNDRYHRYKP